MHDKEKVELGIKACWSEYFSHKCFDCPYVSDRNDRKCVERLGTDALAMLKEQEAVELVKWIYPSDIIGFGRCPHCNSLWDYSLISNRFFKHCPRCGKAVKWNE